MTDRHILSVDSARVAMPGFTGRKMGDDLVSVEIEVDPVRCAAAFWAAEQRSVERARGFEVIDREGEVKRLHLW